jgi:hypothetical protein
MVGVEPTIFRLEGGRVIHCATWALLFLMRLTTQYRDRLQGKQPAAQIPIAGLEPATFGLKGRRSTD